ncbi:MAG: hypothetical protein Kow00104_13390 [Rhodothalassiaceae bacterium]
MSLPDHNPDPQWPRERFLFLAAIMIGLAVLVYLIMGAIPDYGPSAILTAFYTVFAFLLLILVLAALLFLLGYGRPRFGARLASRLQYARDAWSVPMRHLGFFGVRPESARDEKASATRRKLHRQQRRRYGRHAHRK